MNILRYQSHQEAMIEHPTIKNLEAIYTVPKGQSLEVAKAKAEENLRKKGWSSRNAFWIGAIIYIPMCTCLHEKGDDKACPAHGEPSCQEQ